MPSGRLWPYVDMMQQLEAEQSLSRVMDTAAGFGSLEENAQKQYMTQLRHTARIRPKKDPAAAAAMLAALGVPVETIEPTSAGGVVLPAGVEGR